MLYRAARAPNMDPKILGGDQIVKKLAVWLYFLAVYTHLCCSDAG